MIPIFHNTLLATPKLKFYFGVFAHFGAHWGLLGFRGPKSNFTLAHLSFWGVSQSQMLLWGLLPIWGPLGVFGVLGPKITFYSGAFILLGSIPISDFTLGACAHLGPFGVVGPKIKFDFGGFYPSLGTIFLVSMFCFIRFG
jgi:hypothetical protein